MWLAKRVSGRRVIEHVHTGAAAQLLNDALEIAVLGVPHDGRLTNASAEEIM